MTYWRLDQTHFYEQLNWSHGLWYDILNETDSPLPLRICLRRSPQNQWAQWRMSKPSSWLILFLMGFFFQKKCLWMCKDSRGFGVCRSNCREGRPLTNVGSQVELRAWNCYQIGHLGHVKMSSQGRWCSSKMQVVRNVYSRQRVKLDQKNSPPC